MANCSTRSHFNYLCRWCRDILISWNIDIERRDRKLIPLFLFECFNTIIFFLKAFVAEVQISPLPMVTASRKPFKHELSTLKCSLWLRWHNSQIKTEAQGSNLHWRLRCLVLSPKLTRTVQHHSLSVSFKYWRVFVIISKTFRACNCRKTPNDK